MVRQTERRRRWTVITAVLVVLGGCMASRPTPGSRNQRVEVLIGSAPKTLDPRYTIDTKSMNISRLVFSNLVTVDNQRLEPKLDLAHSIRVDPRDPMSQIVTLKTNVRFHDGHALTADDVVYTFRSVMDPRLRSPYANHYKKKIRAVERIDRWRVRFTLFRPYATFITDLVMGIVPRHLLEKHGGRFPPGVYLGSGPYRYLFEEPGRKWVLSRFQRYFGRPAAAPYLVFRVVTDENARLLALLGRTGDIVQNEVNPVLLSVLAARRDVRVVSAPSISYTYLLFNLRQSALADLRVRRAIAHAIDRPWIIKHKFRGYAKLASGMLAPLHWAYEGGVKRYPYQPELAERLLDEAGFTRRGPNRIRLTLRLKSSNNRLRRMVIKDIGYQLGKIGIAVEPVSLEVGTFLYDVRRGNFQIAVLQQPEPVEPDLYHWMFYSMNVPVRRPSGPSAFGRPDRRFFNPALERIHGRWRTTVLRQGLKAWFTAAWGQAVLRPQGNRTFYWNPRVDQLLDSGRYTLDREERRRIYAKVQQILADDLPFVSLWHEDNVAVISRSVTHFTMIPNARYTPLVRVRKGR